MVYYLYFHCILLDTLSELGNIIPTLDANGAIDKKVLETFSVNFPSTYTAAFLQDTQDYLDHILGFDTTTCMPRPGGGYLGYAAYYKALFECNGRMKHHKHILLRILGLPTSGADKVFINVFNGLIIIYSKEI